MSIYRMRLKYYDKYRNRDVKKGTFTNPGELSDLLRACVLRMLHVHTITSLIDKAVDDVVQGIMDDWTEQEVVDYIMRCTPEPNEQKEPNDD